MLPDPSATTTIVSAPAPTPGSWAGAASALWHDGRYYLAWRVRRPVSEGRGVGVALGVSTDGVSVEQLGVVTRELFGAVSLERPALLCLPDGAWRIYLSCATWNSKHWWVDSLSAPTFEGLLAGEQRLVLPGHDGYAVKDPVIVRDGDVWRMWLCCHPLSVLGEEDRMTTRHLTSYDGWHWDDHGVVLAGRPGQWDERGARVTSVVSLDPLTVTYDGRPDAAQNWYETMGVAVERDGRLVPDDSVLLRSPEGDGAFRYACRVPIPDGERWFVEQARLDGSHDLVTWAPVAQQGAAGLPAGS